MYLIASGQTARKQAPSAFKPSYPTKGYLQPPLVCEDGQRSQEQWYFGKKVRKSKGNLSILMWKWVFCGRNVKSSNFRQNK